MVHYVVILFQLMVFGRHGDPTHIAQKAAVQVPRLEREHVPIQVLNTGGYRAVDPQTKQKPATLSFVQVLQYQ